MAIDLHVHTIFSDGTMAPREIVLHAKQNKLKAIAITDHDTTAGIEESLLYGEKFGIHIVPGVEISIQSSLAKNGHLHLLGLFINYRTPHLKKVLGYLRMHRKKRMDEIISKLDMLGINISEKEVNRPNGEVSFGRLHIANVLLKRGYISSIKEAFTKYLKKGASAYVENVKLGEKEGIDLIKNAGGLAILAHPCTHGYPSRERLLKEILRLKEMGLDGLEVYYPYHGKDIIQWLLDITESNNLLISGGSDFHGENTPGIKMGIGKGDQKIPDSIYFTLAKYHESKLGAEF
jgi:predicted metal-dependent phosphoesterase TrpH